MVFSPPMPALCGLVLCATGAPLVAAAAPVEASGVVGKEAGRGAISVVRFRDSAAGAWRMSPVLPEQTSTVYCSFEVEGLAPGARVVVLWRRGGRELARTVRATGQLTRNMTSELASDAPLGSGTYEVEVLVDDVSEVRTSFRIAGEERSSEPEAPTETGPRVLGLTLATGEQECIPDPSGGPRRPLPIGAGVRAIHVCLEFEGMSAGQSLEVRWYRSSAATAPLAVTSYSPDGAGELSASYLDEGLLRPGAHHVAIFLDGAEIARARFTITE